MLEFTPVRRRLVLALAAASVAPPTYSQPSGTLRRVGVVFSTDPQTSRPYLDALLFWMHRRRIVEFCARIRLPASHAYGETVREGGLTSYASRLDDTFRMAGTFVGRILGGATPADLPVEQPTRYELLVNAKTAQTLGIAIPAAMLASVEIVE